MQRDISYWLAITPFELSEADQQSLTQPDDEYVPQTWDDLKVAIGTCDSLVLPNEIMNETRQQLTRILPLDAMDLSLLTRSPSDMQNYLLWRLEMKSSWPDISQYVLSHRIGWRSIVDLKAKSNVPFEQAQDYCIRRNDWPYGLTPDITHMVVWLKTPIEVDEDGDPTSVSKDRIEKFVDRVFRHRIVPNPAYVDQVKWFKNRTRWQSVRSLEHIHVIVRAVDEALVEEWTNQTKSDIVARSWSHTECDK